jgi:SLAP domain-containing protein
MAKIIKANFGSEEKKDIQEIDNNTLSNDGRKPVSLKLSLIEREEAIMSDVQKETLVDELNSFPPVFDGDINIVGVYAFDMGKSWEVKAFLRNGMDRPVNFDKVALVIANSEDEVLAAQTFDMQDAGDIPPYSARPYKLNFNKSNVYVKKVPRDEWHIAFDSNVGTATYEDFDYEGLPDSFPQESLSVLNRFLRGLPKIEKGKYDFSKFSIGINENGEIMISIVVRNGLDKPLSIEKLPVTVKNEEGNVVFSGLFEMHDFNINPGKSKLLSLAGKTGVQLDQDMDLSNFELEFRI